MSTWSTASRRRRSPMPWEPTATSARFLREGKLSARVDHPQVVKVLDVGAEGEHLYLVMEYLGGEDVEGLLTRAGRLSVGVAGAVLVATGGGARATTAWRACVVVGAGVACRVSFQRCATTAR